jgi:hypothetical protein
MQYSFLDTEPANPVTLPLVRQWLKREPNYTAEDAVFEVLAAKALAVAEKHTGLLFTRRQVQAIFYSRPNGIRLKYGPDIEMVSLVRLGVNGIPDTPLTEGIDYNSIGGVFDVGSIHVNRYWRLSLGRMEWQYKAVYNAGFVEAPADIIEAMLQIVAFSYANPGDKATAGPSRQTEGKLTMPPAAREVLDSYSIKTVAL